jgi:hypothetical protein
MSANLVTNIVIGVAVVALLVVRQMSTRRVREDTAFRFMLILGVIGIVLMVDAAKGHPLPARAVLVVVAGLVLAVLLGAVRALTVRIWRDPSGVAWRRGTGWTAALWIVSLAAHLGLDPLAGDSSVAKSFVSASILLYLALTLGVQREVLRARAARLPAAVA